MMLLFFTGLSGSGKSTIADKVISIYHHFILLDGDVLRGKDGLCSDLGFSDDDRKENMRRLLALCKLLAKNGFDVVTTFIAPFEDYRKKIKNEIENSYIIYCNADLETCEKRDVKGLYKKARAGEIKQFTGIDSIYEIPECADLILNTDQPINKCVEEVINFIKERAIKND